MTAARFQRGIVVVLLALVAASVLGTLPHAHADGSGAGLDTGDSPGTHAPRPRTCLEPTAHAANADCAICYFQRVASSGQVVDGMASDTVLPGRDLATSGQATFVADSTCLSDPRAPPAV
jgi:hypothetical protein